MISEAEAVSRYLDSNPIHLEHHLHWHRSNPFPWPPNFSIPDPRNPGNPWPGNDLNYGSKFLRMNRHMIEGFDAWRRSNGFKKVVAWNPARRIPSNLSHTGRQNNNPRLPLESWFTKRGGRRSEPATENRKLGDFDNENQLGAVITWWHNAVHGTIGGDMSFASRALADPVFWHFHKFLDDVYATWEKITDKDPSEEEEQGGTLSVSENNKTNVSPESPDLTFGGKGFQKAYRQEYIKDKLLGITGPLPPSEAKNKGLVKKLFTPPRTVKKISKRAFNPTITLHFRYAGKKPPNHIVESIQHATRQTYGQFNIGVRIKTEGALRNLPPDMDIDVGPVCTTPPSRQQEALFQQGREGVVGKDIVVYFVKTVGRGRHWGCATPPPYSSSCIIAADAPIYTVAHEVGHVLGLDHVDPRETNRLMLKNTGLIKNPPPDLTTEEQNIIINHL